MDFRLPSSEEGRKFDARSCIETLLSTTVGQLLSAFCREPQPISADSALIPLPCVVDALRVSREIEEFSGIIVNLLQLFLQVILDMNIMRCVIMRFVENPKLTRSKIAISSFRVYLYL